MGVTIEQYRARIGAHNNWRIKVDSTQLEGNNVDVITFGNNNYDIINYIDVNILPEWNLIFANKEVDRTI